MPKVYWVALQCHDCKEIIKGQSMDWPNIIEVPIVKYRVSTTKLYYSKKDFIWKSKIKQNQMFELQCLMYK